MYQGHPLRTRRDHLRGLLPSLLALVLIPAAVGTFPSSATAQRSASVTVSAAISMKDALDELGNKYERAHPETTIHFNYGGSGTLQHQIEQGAPVDLFFSAAEEQMDQLASERLIDASTRRDIAANDLVLIILKDSHVVANFQDLGQPAVKFVAVGEPTAVPAGLYAQQTLDHLGLLAPIKSKLVFAKDVRQVLTYVESGNADAGLVYATDAKISSKVQVVATAPASSHEPIRYPAAVLRESKNISAARDFLDYVAGPEGRSVLKNFGFTSPEK